jgi:hypothetical protein
MDLRAEKILVDALRKATDMLPWLGDRFLKIYSKKREMKLNK